MANNYKTLTLNQVKDLFIKDNELRKANKSANAPILKIIDLIGNDNLKTTCEFGKGGYIPNRGSLVECLVKLLFLHQKSASKYANGRRDMYTNGTSYEIKFSSTKGYAHYEPSESLKNLIFVDGSGIYGVVDGAKAIILDKCGKHIQTINKSMATKIVAF